MKCLRCGYCCKNYSVVVVNDPKKGIKGSNLIFHKGEGKSCIHLLEDSPSPGKCSCAIHHYEWYKDTPCFAHGQIESDPNDLCRMGNYILHKSKV